MVNTEVKLMIFIATEYGKFYRVSKTRPGADYGSDHELLIAKFRHKLKKVGKPTRYSGMTYQIHYSGSDKEFKGLYLIYRVPEELWMEVHDIVQKEVIKIILKKKKCKKEKWLPEEAF